ncbi:hypothetical protein L7F22_051865 [Adiantum nelumboides]|nr:hypothetical protein [Adiantum nelumboides]
MEKGIVMDDEGVQVVVESSWTVLKGSLQSCVSVVFLDPDTHEPIISSSSHPSTKLVLVPPAEPVPCEITVKFWGRLCHVQSLYTSSTARICEIYSRSDLETDPEYVCTVKGWISCKDDFSSENGTEKNLEDAATKGGDQVLVKGSECPSDKSDTDLMSSGASSMPASNQDGDDECQKSIYSSGEDSWVNVKLNGSFSAESGCASLMAPDLDNWHVPLNVEELVHLEDQLGMANVGLEAENIELENAVKLSDRSCEGKAPFEQVGQGSSCLDMFEAEVELVDHNPWAAVTIRLLSLQDKSVVEIDQMVFLAISGPIPEPPASTRQSNGTAPTPALFAMFLPSILQIARGVSGKKENLLNCEKFDHPCEQKQDIMGVSFAEKEVCATPEEVPILKNTTPCLSSVHSVVESVFSESNASTELEKSDQSSLPELDADDNVLERIREPVDLTLPTCNCKEFVGDVIGKELAKTFDAFSKRFDRLESLCLRLESFLHKSFESLDQRIRCLEGQHTQDFVESDPACKPLGNLSDVAIMQSHQNDYLIASQVKQEILSPMPECADKGYSAMQHQSNHQIDDEASLLNQIKSEVSSTLIEPDHFEVHPVANEASYVNDVESHSANVEDLVKERTSEVQELSRDPELVVNVAAKDNLPYVSLDDAWASALSAFASSFPSVHSCAENNDTNKQFSASALYDDSILNSHCVEESKEGRNGSSPSTYLDVTAITNCVDNEVVSSGHGPTCGVSKESPCHEQVSAAPEGWGILPPSHSITSKPVSTFDFLSAFSNERINPVQKSAGGMVCAKSVESVEGQDMPLPSYCGQPEPVNGSGPLHPEVPSSPDDFDGASSHFFSQQMAVPSSLQFDALSSAQSYSMLGAETLDNWGARGSLATPLSLMFQSLSDVNQDAASKSPSYMYNIDSDVQKTNLSRGNDEYVFAHRIAALDTHAMWQRSFSLLFDESGNSHGARSEEESSCNGCLELDFLSGQILSEQKERSSIAEVQDPKSFKGCMMTEEASSIPDLLDDSSHYQDGRTCSQDSLCFSQDFEACQNDLSDTRWSHSRNIFFMHDPELTDDESDNIAGGLDERTESSDSILQDELSDIDSTEDLPFWPARHSAREDEQQSTIFPGFEDFH